MLKTSEVMGDIPDDHLNMEKLAKYQRRIHMGSRVALDKMIYYLAIESPILKDEDIDDYMEYIKLAAFNNNLDAYYLLAVHHSSTLRSLVLFWYLAKKDIWESQELYELTRDMIILKFIIYFIITLVVIILLTVLWFSVGYLIR